MLNPEMRPKMILTLSTTQTKRIPLLGQPEKYIIFLLSVLGQLKKDSKLAESSSFISKTAKNKLPLMRAKFRDYPTIMY